MSKSERAIILLALLLLAGSLIHKQVLIIDLQSRVKTLETDVSTNK